ncbi:nuclear migration protein JNM1, partial [Phenoliferia sp. Uapishka_3]
MSSSKYASLPDIDSAPDVYETPDVPAEVSHEGDSDSDSELPRAGSPSTRRAAQPGLPASENIDNTRLDTSDARRRFGAASAAAGLTDASNRKYTSRRLPSTNSYSTASRTGLDGSEKETTLERLRRLRSEIEELEQDVQREKAEETASPDFDAHADPKGKKRAVTPGVILQQLQLLRGDLGGVEAKVTGDLEGEGEKDPGVAPPTGLAQKAKASSSLLSKLGFASGPQPVEDQKSAPLPKVSSANPPLESGHLEKRISEMERVLGASEADVDESHPLPPPLLQTLTRLDHLLTLLTQPRHLDGISRRVKVLVSDLERLHESRRKLGDTRPLNIALSGGMTVAVAGSGDAKATSGPPASSSAPKPLSGGGSGEPIPPDTLQKIDTLFTLLPRLDPLLPLTPRLLTRLRSLATLHSSAATFGDTLEELKAEVQKLDEGEKGLREVVAGLEQSVEENESKVRGNLEGLEGRLGSLVQRMEHLGL